MTTPRAAAEREPHADADQPRPGLKGESAGRGHWGNLGCSGRLKSNCCPAPANLLSPRSCDRHRRESRLWSLAACECRCTPAAPPVARHAAASPRSPRPGHVSPCASDHLRRPLLPIAARAAAAGKTALRPPRPLAAVRAAIRGKFVGASSPSCYIDHVVLRGNKARSGGVEAGPLGVGNSARRGADHGDAHATRHATRTTTCSPLCSALACCAAGGERG